MREQARLSRVVIQLISIKNSLLLYFAFHAIITPHHAHAFVPIRSSGGATAHWDQGSNIRIRTNEKNNVGIASNDLFTVLSTSLNRWKQAASNGFDFTLFQGTDTSKFPVNINSAGMDSEIFFTSQGGGSVQCGIVAVTQLYFDQNSGRVQRFDLRFNDACHPLSMNPRDTGSSQRIFIGDVAEHELGHALGLDHSQNVQSSMIYTTAPEMSRPSCDDQAAMIDAYSPGSVRGHAGEITGVVVAPSGAGVIGAHVNAISLERGVVLSSALSLKDGSFRIGGLEKGSYALVVEPFFPGSGSLSGYFSDANPNVCNGTKFERTFVKDGNVLKNFTVSEGSATSASTIMVSCQAPASLNTSKENSFGTAPVLAQSSLVAPLSVQGVFSGSTVQYYSLKNQSGHIEVAALTQTLFSNPDVNVEILNTSGQRINQWTNTNAFSSNESGFVNYDSNSSADLVGTQDIVIKVSSSGTLSTSVFPSGSLGISSTPYYVVTVSRGTANDGSILFAKNARCEAVDSFGAYPRQGDPGPVMNGGGSSSGQSQSSGGCGMIKNASKEDRTNQFLNFAILLMMITVVRTKVWARRQGA